MDTTRINMARNIAFCHCVMLEVSGVMMWVTGDVRPTSSGHQRISMPPVPDESVEDSAKKGGGGRGGGEGEEKGFEVGAERPEA
jgi:hypothetical protein